MKGKLKSIGRVAMALVLAVSLGLITAAPVMAEHTSSATVAFTEGASTVAGEESSLDVRVTNTGSADSIQEVTVDFSGTDFTDIGVGTLPDGWTGEVDAEGIVVTYTASGADIAPGGNVTFVPTVTNPTVAGDYDTPAVSTTDDGPTEASATIDTDIVVTAQEPGADGNDISITVTVTGAENGGDSATIEVSLTGDAITVAVTNDIDTDNPETVTRKAVADALNMAESGTLSGEDYVGTSAGDEKVDVTINNDVTGWVVGSGGSGNNDAAEVHETNLSGGTDQEKDKVATVEPPATLTVNNLFAPLQGPAGATVTVTGSGFTPESAVSIKFDGTKLATEMTDASGSFTKEVTVPQVAADEYLITAAGVARTMSAPFTVTEPALSLDLDYGGIGGSTNVAATGFEVDEVLTLQYCDSWDEVEGATWADWAPQLTGTGADYSWVGVEIPTGLTIDEDNNANFRVVQTAEKYVAYALFEVLSPAIELDPSRGLVDYKVTVTGNYFTPSDVSVIEFDGEVVGGEATGTDGSFTATFDVPALDPDTYTVTAYDGQGLEDEATFTILASAEPELSINPVFGPIEDSEGVTELTLSASGFAANDALTVEYLDRIGTWVDITTGFDSPSTGAGGSWTDTLQDKDILSALSLTEEDNFKVFQTEDEDISATAYFEITPTIEVSVDEGKAGDPVTISGWAFRDVELSRDGVVIPDAELGDMAYGVETEAGEWTSYTVTWTVPETPGGEFTISAEDSEGLTAETSFEILTDAAIDLASGQVGDEIGITGTGFAASSTVTISFDGTDLSDVITTDENGTIEDEQAFAVPELPGTVETPYGVTITGTEGRVFEGLTFSIEPSLVATPENVFVGDEVTLIGKGFGADESVTLDIAGEALDPATTDASGSFEVTRLVPAGLSDEVTITATGEDSELEATATVTVELTLYLSFLRNSVEVSGSWPGKEFTIKVTDQADDAVEGASIYVDTVKIDETTAEGILAYTFEDADIYTIKAISGGSEVEESFEVASPVLTLKAEVDDEEYVEVEELQINPGVQSFQLTDQFGYPIYEEGNVARLRVEGLTVTEFGADGLASYTYEVGESWLTDARWTYETTTLTSNAIVVMVREASLSVEPLETTVVAGETVEFTGFNEWEDAVTVVITGITPGTNGVEWTYEDEDNTATFNELGTYTLTLEDERPETAEATIVVGIPAGFTLANLAVDPTEGTAPLTITVTADVTNNGDVAGDYTAELKVDDEVVDSQVVTVAAGATVTVTFEDYELTDPGTYQVTIDTLTAIEVTALAPADLSIANLAIDPTEGEAPLTITVTADVTNTGDVAGDYTAELKVDDAVVDSQEVSVAAGDTEIVSFTHELADAGTFQVTIDTLTAIEVTVTEAAGPTIQLYEGANPILYTGATMDLPGALTDIETITEIIWQRDVSTGGAWYSYLVSWGIGEITQLRCMSSWSVRTASGSCPSSKLLETRAGS